MRSIVRLHQKKGHFQTVFLSNSHFWLENCTFQVRQLNEAADQVHSRTWLIGSTPSHSFCHLITSDLIDLLASGYNTEGSPPTSFLNTQGGLTDSAKLPEACCRKMSPVVYAGSTVSPSTSQMCSTFCRYHSDDSKLRKERKYVKKKNDYVFKMQKKQKEKLEEPVLNFFPDLCSFFEHNEEIVCSWWGVGSWR